MLRNHNAGCPLQHLDCPEETPNVVGAGASCSAAQRAEGFTTARANKPDAEVIEHLSGWKTEIFRVRFVPSTNTGISSPQIHVVRLFEQGCNHQPPPTSPCMALALISGMTPSFLIQFDSSLLMVLMCKVFENDCSEALECHTPGMPPTEMMMLNNNKFSPSEVRKALLC